MLDLDYEKAGPDQTMTLGIYRLGLVYVPMYLCTYVPTYLAVSLEHHLSIERPIAGGAVAHTYFGKKRFGTPATQRNASELHVYRYPPSLGEHLPVSCDFYNWDSNWQSLYSTLYISNLILISSMQSPDDVGGEGSISCLCAVRVML